jgi:hypothetical protein
MIQNIKMMMRRIQKLIKKTHWILLLVFLLMGCTGKNPPEVQIPEIVFLPPTAGSSTALNPPPVTPLPATQQRNCVNQLRFVKDLTIPDGTKVLPGERITKRWLVHNEGSCNWDSSYSFILISGLALGADKIQMLYPARQGTRAVLEVLFTAPDNPGRYNSWWQASDGQGNRFGDPVYMDITVIQEEQDQGDSENVVE